MRPRLRESLLWGAVGAMSFLVLVQGYTLVARPRIGFLPKLGVAVLVGAAATALSYVAEGYRGVDG